LDSSRRFAAASLEVSALEDMVQDLVYDIERELTGAALVSPTAPLVSSLSGNATIAMNLTTTAGFPPVGTVVVDRGTNLVEIIAYKGIDANTNQLLDLTRGLGCTEDGSHPTGPSDVLWGGLAELIDNQINPDQSAFDGTAQGEDRLEYFRGLGTGIVFRVPVDPTGNNNVLDGDQLQWGASLNEFGPTENGYYAIYFEVSDTYEESRFETDINNDGDSVDTFDIGQLRRVVWDASDPSRAEDVGIGPRAVLQESCNWGSDLDGDGANDPMFLFNESRRTLHIRLTVIGRATPDQPIVRSVESVIYLRNDPDA
ncbi:MAG: hypothetical protein ACI8PQ_002433, partial [Planctomycetota bacterium]